MGASIERGSSCVSRSRWGVKALFIAELAFQREELLNRAKLAILVASVISAALGYGVLRFVSRTREARES